MPRRSNPAIGEVEISHLITLIMAGKTKPIEEFFKLHSELVSKEIDKLLTHIFASQNIEIVKIFVNYLTPLAGEKIFAALLENEKQNNKKAQQFSEEVIKFFVENSYHFEFAGDDKNKYDIFIKFNANNPGLLRLLKLVGAETFKSEKDKPSIFVVKLDEFSRLEKSDKAFHNLKSSLLHLLAVRKVQGVKLPPNNKKIYELLRQIEDKDIQAAVENLKKNKTENVVESERTESIPVRRNTKRKADTVVLPSRQESAKAPRSEPEVIKSSSSSDNMSNTSSEMFSPNLNSNGSISDLEQQRTGGVPNKTPPLPTLEQVDKPLNGTKTDFPQDILLEMERSWIDMAEEEAKNILNLNSVLQDTQVQTDQNPVLQSTPIQTNQNRAITANSGNYALRLTQFHFIPQNASLSLQNLESETELNERLNNSLDEVIIPAALKTNYVADEDEVQDNQVKDHELELEGQILGETDETGWQP